MYRNGITTDITISVLHKEYGLGIMNSHHSYSGLISSMSRLTLETIILFYTHTQEIVY